MPSMFAFFKSLAGAKPHIAFQCHSESDIVFSDLLPMPDSTLLSIGNDRNKNSTIIELIDPIKHKKLREITLEDKYKFLCTFSDKQLLLYDDHAFSKKLFMFDYHTLNKEEFAGIKIDRSNWVEIGNKKFASFSLPNYKNEALAFQIVTHDFNTNEFNQPASLPLPKDKERGYGMSGGELIKLANGQFACQLLGHNTNYFKVFVFDKTDDAKYPFKLAHILEPSRENSHESLASGHFVGLPNGDILTYHASGQNFEVWHDGECIDYWSWGSTHQSYAQNNKDYIQCNDKTFNHGFWTNKILPMPDNEHLLCLVFGVKLFLFNMATGTMNAVKLGNIKPYDIDVFPNGQVIVRGNQGSQAHAHQLFFVDLPEMQPYAKKFEEMTSAVTCEDEYKAEHAFGLT